MAPLAMQEYIFELKSIQGFNYYKYGDQLFFNILPVKNIEVDDDVYIVDVNFDGGAAKLCLMNFLQTGTNYDEKPEEINLAKKFLDFLMEHDFLGNPGDVLILHEEDFEKYLKYKSTSFFWGGYIHQEDELSFFDYKRKSTDSIVVEGDYSIESIRHRKCLLEAANSSSATERFLHLFHFLELDYDYEIVKKVKSLDQDNPIGLWGVLSQQRSDIERLNYLMSGFSNFQFLKNHILKLRNYQTQVIDIFFNYQKESNPIKVLEEFKELFFNSSNISQQEFLRIKRDKSLNLNCWSTEESFNKKLIELCCYWIYRVRCSIAHNKLGDYHILDRDLPFVVEFCEPILKEFIKYRIISR